MAIDHFCITVPPSEHKKMVDFYLAALQPLGYTKMIAYGPNEEAVGLGVNGKADYWITATPDAPAKLNLHFAFTTSGTPTTVWLCGTIANQGLSQTARSWMHSMLLPLRLGPRTMGLRGRGLNIMSTTTAVLL